GGEAAKDKEMLGESNFFALPGHQPADAKTDFDAAALGDESKKAGAEPAEGVRLRRMFERLDGDTRYGKAVDVLNARGGRAPQPRERFVETAYWNPGVVTGTDGKARVTFTAPRALSAYQITARGVTGSDTLVGQTTAELRVRKDFFVDLKVPAALTQG